MACRNGAAFKPKIASNDQTRKLFSFFTASFFLLFGHGCKERCLVPNSGLALPMTNIIMFGVYSCLMRGGAGKGAWPRSQPEGGHRKGESRDSCLKMKQYTHHLSAIRATVPAHTHTKCQRISKKPSNVSVLFLTINKSNK